MRKQHEHKSWALTMALALGGALLGCDDSRNSEAERASHQTGMGTEDAGDPGDPADAGEPEPADAGEPGPTWRCDWERQEVPIRNDLLIGAVGFGPGDIYAVSAYDVYHYDGQGWSSDPASRPPLWGDSRLTAIAGSSGQDLFITLAESDSAPGAYDRGELLRLGESDWEGIDSSIPARPNALALFTEKYLFLVGNSGMIMRCDRTLAEAACRAMESRTDKALHGVTAAGRFAYAVGDDGVIVRFDGDSWYAMASPTAKTLRAVAAAPNGPVYAVGDDGVIVRLNGDAWEAMESPTAKALRAVAAAPDGPVYAVGDDGAVLVLDGEAWRLKEADTAMQLLGAVAFAGNQIVAVGEDLGRVACDGSACSAASSAGEWMLLDVAGPETDDLYGVGPFGTIVHYDGSAWQAMESPTRRHILRVGPSAPNLVYALEDTGMVLRYDGVRWQPLPAQPPEPLSGFYAAPNGEIFGSSSDTMELYHYDGSAWQRFEVEGFYGGGVVGGRSQSDVYVLDSESDFLHFDGQSWHIELENIETDSLTCENWGDCVPVLFGMAVLDQGGFAMLGMYLEDGRGWISLPAPVSQYYSLHIDDRGNRFVVNRAFLYGMDGIAPDALMALGFAADPSADASGMSLGAPGVWRFDGDEWNLVDAPSLAGPNFTAGALGPGFIHMAGNGDVFLSQTSSQVLHGTNCAPMEQ